MIFPPPNTTNIVLTAAALATSGPRAASVEYDRFLRLFPLWVGMSLSALGGLFLVIAWFLAGKVGELRIADPVGAFGLSLPIPGLMIGGALAGAIGLVFVAIYLLERSRLSAGG